MAHSELNFPISYIAFSLFFAISVAIGNCRTLVLTATWKVKAILFMAFLGSPGAVKSHPVKFAISPFLMADAFTINKYREELQKWQQLPVDSRGPKPQPRQLRLQDTTMEALMHILECNRRGVFIYEDELKAWISSFNKYSSGGGDMERWLSIHSGMPITYNRKTDDSVFFVEKPFVGVIGSLQPGIMAKLFNSDKMENGFFSRLLFVPNSSEGEPLLWHDFDLPSGIENEWAEIINKILADSGYFEGEISEKEYHFSNEAWTLIVDWQNERERQIVDEPEYITAIFRKIQDACLRFCLVIHTMREAAGDISESNEIDATSAYYATLVADYFFETSQESYEMVETGNVNNEKFFQLLNGLNETFTSAQAKAVGERIGISRATVYRYLTIGENDQFIMRISKGRYQKK